MGPIQEGDCKAKPKEGESVDCVYLEEGDVSRGKTGIEKQGKQCGWSRGSEGSVLGQELKGAGHVLSLK